MKHIIKSKKEPEALKLYRETTPDARFKSDFGEEKPLKKSIGSEQGWICCYCNQRIDLNAMTVEHYITQKRHSSSPYSQKKHTANELNYKNLLGSCNTYERNCSGIRGNTFLHYINPLDKSCEEKLSYRKKIKNREEKDFKGNIIKINSEVIGYEIYVAHGANQLEIQQEIDKVLQLNTDALCKAREIAIQRMQKKLHNENRKDWTNEMIEKEITEVLKRKKIDSSDMLGFSPFCMAVAHYLRTKLK